MSEVLFGSTDGSFTPGPAIFEGDTGFTISAGDLNGDGHLDLVLADVLTSEIVVLFGTGRGDFSEEHRVGTGGSPALALVDDLNRDGRDDVAVLDVEHNDVAVFITAEDGSPVAGPRTGAGITPVGATIANFNLDKWPDVVVTDFTGAIHVLLGRGDGSFNSPVDSFPGGYFYYSVVPADLNGDGRQDLVLADWFNFNTRITTLLGKGDGTFAPPMLTHLEEVGFTVAVGDFDADGTPDLAASTLSGIAILTGSGDGSFILRQTLPLSDASIYNLAAADLDGDGRTDLAGTVFNSQNVLVFLNEGSFPNRGPVARAGTDARLECGSSAGKSVLVDGSGSSDADSTPGTNDDIVSFEWFENYGLPGQTNLGAGMMLSVSLPLGSHTITLKVTDSQGATSTDDLIVSVVDSTPPALTCPAPATAECAGPYGAPVAFAPSAADVCSTPVTISESRALLLPGGGSILYPGVGPGGMIYPSSTPFMLGTTQVTFTATDAAGNSTACTSTVTVADTAPPTLSVAASPVSLWPPNHRMVAVLTQVVASDVCDLAAAVALLPVASSEPDDAPGAGDGNTKNDIQDADTGTADFELALRAERAGTGPGRIYTVSYTATDHSGNSAVASSTVAVPHDEGGVVEPVLVTAEDSVAGTLLRWSAAPGALYYNVVRGSIGNLRETTDIVDLGALACVEPGSHDTSSAGYEDPEAPAPGEARFYLVDYNSGASSSFGTEAVGKPRVASSGGCTLLSSGSGTDSRRRAP